MAAKKLSITLPGEIAERVHEIAEKEGVPVSALLADAAEVWLRQKAAQDAIRAFEAEEGPLTEAELAEARAIGEAGDAYMLGGEHAGRKAS